MLERVALHQTRLRVPGVALDARGVVLGSKGLVLLPSLDRLVAFLAVYTEGQGLDSIAGSLSIDVVRSKLGTREVALSFDAGSSDRMDRAAEVAVLAGGFTFTGTSRHFVQYRDAAAPFGYDVAEITATDAPFVLYHATFSQTYASDRSIKLKDLLLRLMPHPEPRAGAGPGPLFVLAEPGLGPLLLHYLVRSRVDASCGIAEWPPETSFDEAPRKRWLFRIPDLLARMRPTIEKTPGLTSFWPVCPGAAVERGFRHPISLRACPVFDERSLVLFRGRGETPLVVDPMPVLADLRSLERAELHPEPLVAVAAGQRSVPAIQVKLKLVPSLQPPATITATIVSAEEFPLLRKLVYALGAEAIRTTRIAVTAQGAFVLRERGAEMLPLGSFYRRIHPSIYVPSGLELKPAVSPEVVFSALGAPEDKLVFFRRDASVVALDKSAFVPLEQALIEPERWAPLEAIEFDAVLATETPSVWLEPLGIRPLKRAEPAP